MKKHPDDETTLEMLARELRANMTILIGSAMLLPDHGEYGQSPREKAALYARFHDAIGEMEQIMIGIEAESEADGERARASEKSPQRSQLRSV